MTDYTDLYTDEIDLGDLPGYLEEKRSDPIMDDEETGLYDFEELNFD